MTLSTRADHEAGRRAERAYEEADSHPYAIAEGIVNDAAGDATDRDPAAVDPQALADEAAREAREDMADAAAPYGRGAAERAADRAGREAHDYVLEMVEEDPRLVEREVAV